MKVIALVESNKYICEVTHREIEKFLNLYYGKMSHLKTNDVVDLEKGYNFHNETTEALKKTRDFIDSNKNIIDSIMSGFRMLDNLQNSTEE